MAPSRSFDLETLATAIPIVFDQAQCSAATHKKNCVALYKLQSASSEFTEVISKGKKIHAVRLAGEKAFTDSVLDMLNRVLVVKRGTPNADRIVRFVGSYVKFLSDKPSTSNDTEEEEDTPLTRFTSRLLKHFMKGFIAKSKIVRFRCLTFVFEMIQNLGEIDQDMYTELRSGLLERLGDKEPHIRALCVACLSKLAISEDPEDLEDGEETIISSMLECLLYDPAAEVRRSALIHIPFTPATLPALLSRTRDVDPVTRKLVYSTILSRLAQPKQLTIAQREQIVAQGLGDREEAVRVAAAKLLGNWLDSCEGDLVLFLQLFDVRTTEVSTDALKSVFVTRVEIIQNMEFDDSFWSKLQPESALLARTFVEHCIDTKDQPRLEATLPVVTALAFLLQKQYNSFLDVLQKAEEARLLDDGEDEEAEAMEDSIADAELIMAELLILAVHLDYSDEIGRRKMFGVVREMLAHPELPETLVRPCIGVLNVMSANERDLIRIIVEVINELRDPESPASTIDDEMSDADATTMSMQIHGNASRSKRQTDDMTVEENAQADVMDLRCLTLTIAVLERVNGTFEENSTLEGILTELIVPAVKRKELPLREKGLISLGLCCLIAKNMAMSSFQLFLSQVKNAPELLRVKVLQVIFDIMMTYEKDLLGGPDEIGKRVIAFLMQVLEAEESKTVQALICQGLAKLMLFGLVTDERVLTSLVLAYVSPVTVDNQDLRQSLAYFLPVYCYSSQANQTRMQSIFVTAYDLVNRVYEDMEDEQNMVTPLQFGQLLVDWTDPSKVVDLSDSQPESSPVHLDLAVDILKALYDSDRTHEDKKVLCQLLSKLNLPDEADQERIFALYIIASNLTEQCPFEDVATEKTFLRFRTRIEKQFSASLEGYDEQEIFHEDAYKELFGFIGIMRPRKRRFEAPSIARGTAESDAEDELQHLKLKRDKQKNPVVRKNADDSSDDRLSETSTSEIREDEREHSQKSRASHRARANGKKAPRGKSAESSSDNEMPVAPSSATASEELIQSPVPPQPSTPPRRKSGKRIHTPTKTPSTASPAPKRQNRTATMNAAAKGKKVAKLEPLANATNRSGTATTRATTNLPQRAGSRKAVKNPINDSVKLEESMENDVDASRPYPVYMPPLIEEKIGWGDSSDI